MTVSFPMIEKCSNIFSGLFSPSSPSGTPVMPMLVHLTLSQRFLKLSSFLFILLSLSCYVSVISTILSSSSLIHSSASFILLLISSNVFFISAIVFFNSVWLFFIFPSFLLKTYCSLIHSFLSSWISFIIFTLNSLSGRLPVSSSVSRSSGVLPCTFIWNIFLCRVILFKFLFLFVLF